MTKVVLDSRTCELFLNMKQASQIVDEKGHLLGLFTPIVDAALLEPQIGALEIQRRLRSGGGRSLESILRNLEQRS